MSFSYSFVQILNLEGVLLQLFYHFVQLLFELLVLFFKHIVEDSLLALFVLVVADVEVVRVAIFRVRGGAAVARFVVMR